MWILIVAVVLLATYVVATYNSFVSLRNRARAAWSDIDVQLRRRYDLVPNLVETVKGYAAHEKAVFEDTTRLRSQAISAEGAAGKSGVESQFTGAIKSLFAVAESYPELRADQNFRQLQSQLSEIEDTIQYARRYYNAVVRDLNTKLEVFPSNIVGSGFGFSRLEYFQAEGDERAPVKVDLGGTQ